MLLILDEEVFLVEATEGGHQLTHEVREDESRDQASSSDELKSRLEDFPVKLSCAGLLFIIIDSE